MRFMQVSVSHHRHLHKSHGHVSTMPPESNNRTICVPFEKESYQNIIQDAVQYRAILDEMIVQYPELFPPSIHHGYLMKDIRFCKKLEISIRRIEIEGTNYTVRPSFVLPYMSGWSEDVSNALFLRKFGVPFWALSHVFGRDPKYWYRIETSLGRNSLVGTTIRFPETLPDDLVADEKHSRRQGEKIYIATTVGEHCILGVSIACGADESSLKPAYKVFKDEAQTLQPHYSPDSVNLDGWEATQNAWKSLFPSMTIILCFLHLFIKMRDRARLKYKVLFQDTATRLWNCYAAPSKASFSQSVRRLHEWARQQQLPDVLMNPINKLKKYCSAYAVAYDSPNSHRTSNMLDRLMQRMDRHLFSAQYFHGTLLAAELNIRAWALIYNFAPSNPYTIKQHQGWKSPAERINQFRYHEDWIQNLLISASLGGYRSPPLNPT